MHTRYQPFINIQSSTDMISSAQKQQMARFILTLDRHQKCVTFGVTVNKHNDGNDNT
jgi:hypothetical protein